VGQIRTFMLVIGPVSSLFDLLTFWLLLHVLHADARLFQSGWFVESLVTQSLVIFVIRSHGPLRTSRPHPLLVGTSLTVAGAAMVLPWTAVGRWFGLVPPPWTFYPMLVAIVCAYLSVVSVVRRHVRLG
jgi:Mg2+-importing ATPase